jgi:diaminopimelate decarboxylase
MSDGELKIGGIAASRLVSEFGEPIYAYDAAVMEGQYDNLRQALPECVDIMYSVKANPSAAIIAFLGNKVSGMEVSSLREMYAAEAAGISPSRMIFVGPAKSSEELTWAVARQVGCIVAESEEELHTIEQIGCRLTRTVTVALRINPLFDSAGARLKMGGAARQFGVDEEAAIAVWKGAGGFRAASLAGVHVYMGTRILDYRTVVQNTREVFALASRLQESSGVALQWIDFGGGLGVPYSPSENEFDLTGFAAEMAPVMERAQKDFPGARFLMECGRYLVADSGVYLTRVRYIKTSRGQRFALVSGGMNHHMATTSAGSLIKTHFPMEVVTRLGEAKTESYTICGPLCTPADVLGRAIAFPTLRSGDLIGVLRSGAYGRSASPIEFLSHGRPAEVLVRDGRASLIRVSSSVESILDDQLIPDMHSTPAGYDRSVASNQALVAPGCS